MKVFNLTTGEFVTLTVPDPEKDEAVARTMEGIAKAKHAVGEMTSAPPSDKERHRRSSAPLQGYKGVKALELGTRFKPEKTMEALKGMIDSDAIQEIALRLKGSEVEKDLLRFQEAAMEEAPPPDWTALGESMPTVPLLAPWLPVPRVLVAHPDFGPSLPPLTGCEFKYRAPSNRYETEKLQSHIAAMQSGTMMTIEALNSTATIFNCMIPFAEQGIFDEVAYRRGILPLISPFTPSHTDLEEHGIGSVALREEPIPFDLQEAFQSWLTQAIARIRRNGIAEHYCKGKILLMTAPGGFFRGKSRSSVSASFTIVQMAIAKEAKGAGMKLADVNAQLFPRYGNQRIYEANRAMVTAKIIPEWHQGTIRFSKNHVLRRRGMFPSDKLSLAWNKECERQISFLLFLFENIPRHTDAGEEHFMGKVAAEVKAKAAAKGNLDLRHDSTDVGKSDKSIGLERLRRVLTVFDNASGASFLTEASVILTQIRGNQMVDLEMLSQLFSGISSTTPVNFAIYGVYGASLKAALATGLTYTEIFQSKIKAVDSLLDWIESSKVANGAWPDTRSIDAEKYKRAKSVWEGPAGVHAEQNFGDDVDCFTSLSAQAIEDFGEKYNFRLTSEKWQSFLGDNRGKGTLESVTLGKDPGAAASKIITGEGLTSRIYPFSAIAHAARCSMFADRAMTLAVHESIRHFAPYAIDMPFLEWDDFLWHVQDVALPAAMRMSSGAAELADIFQFIARGDPDLLDAAMNEILTEDLIAFFKSSSVLTDFADVQKAADSGHLDSVALSAIDSIREDPTTWHRAIQEMAIAYNLVYTVGDPIR